MVRHSFLAVTLALFLGGCASNLDSSFQDITLKTPGVEDAECRMNNGIAVWVLRSNQTVSINRHDEDLRVECYASGNREAHVIIDRNLNPWALANVVTGIVPGVAYDHFSGGLYTYPHVLTIDMGPVRPYDLPDYMRTQGMDPSQQPIENYGPGMVKKDEDRYYVRPGVRQMDLNEILSRSHPLGAPRDTSPATPYGAQ